MRACALGLLLTAICSTAQTTKTDIPRLHDEKPDLNGVWDIPYTPDMARGVPGGLPLTPLGAEDFKNYDPVKFDYTGHCLPAGLTRLCRWVIRPQVSCCPSGQVSKALRRAPIII